MVSEKNNTIDILNDVKNVCFDYTGEIARSIDFVKKKQLYDRILWRKFVNQFRLRSDSQNAGWKGEYWGKMMRGACAVYLYDKDKELYAVLEESVKDIISTQDADGRISTYTFETEFSGWDVWCRKYVMIGMEYFYDICTDEFLKNEILNSLSKQADYIMSHIGNENGKISITDTSTAWGCVNSCSILEAYVWLYVNTNKASYFDFANYIIETGGCKEGNLLTIALENKLKPHEYPSRKAYEVMSFFNGLLEMYRITGNKDYFTAVNNFVKSIKDNDLSIIGCCGCDEELFDNSSKTQTEYHKIAQETCVTVTWIQLCYEMLRLTGDSSYADLIEQATYNALYSSINYDDNKDWYYVPDDIEKISLPFDSYSPLVNNRRGIVPGGFQVFSDKTYYGCCACIGAFGVGLVPQVSVMQFSNGFAFNVYESGKVFTEWNGQSVKFCLTTSYPYGNFVKIRIETANSLDFEVKLRIPSWSEETECYVNGERISKQENGYICVSKLWHFGDEITLYYRSQLKAVVLNDKVAVKLGAIVLANDERFNDKINENVSIKIKNGKVCGKTVVNYPFKAKFVSDIECLDGKIVRLCDYASAGFDWKNNKNKVTVWMNR